MKKAALYIRVSTLEQAQEGYSIGAQQDKLVAYCQANDWSVYDIYVDGGYSGGSLERPALQRLLMELNHFDIILVYKLDRLSRSQKDTLFLIEDQFLSKNIDFVSLSESFDTTTPFGRAIIGILSVFAQLERETIKERVKLGKEKRTQEGLWRGGGNVPPGYKYMAERNELIIEPYEAAQIREIFKLYKEGYGYSKIADRLTAMGYRKNNGSRWQINAIRRVLKNSIYKGYVTYKGKLYQGIHEPIIEKSLFNNTQKQLQERSRKSQKPSKYLLGGMLWCGHCGSRMKATWVTRNTDAPKYYYYVCYSAAGSPKHMVKDYNCPGKHIPMEKINPYVIKQVLAKPLDEKKLIRAYHESYQATDKVMDLSLLKEKSLSIDTQIARLIDLYQYAHISSEALSQRISVLRKNKVELDDTIRSYEAANEVLKIELNDILTYIHSINNLQGIWDEASFEEKRCILRSFIERITVTEDVIDIHWSSD